MKEAVAAGRWWLQAFAFLGLWGGAAAAMQEERGAVAFRQALRDAASDARIAVFGSHPDSNHLLALAVLRHGRAVDTVAVVATRGEGGQNAEGPELWRDLGVVRTHEGDRSVRLLGGQVWFLNLPDEGFVRTAQEALARWGRAHALRAMVEAIRTLRPDVVLTLHGPQDGHGHDRALHALLPEAVRLAADPGFATPGLAPHRVGRGFRGAPPEEARLQMDLEAFDRLRGATHREKAYRALQVHRSQFPLPPLEEVYPSAVFLDAFTPLAPGEPADLLSGLPTLWDRREELAARAARAGIRVDLLRLRRLSEELPHLEETAQAVRTALELLGRLRSLAAAGGAAGGTAGDVDRRLERRIRALERAVVAGAGLGAAVEVEAPGVLAPGRPLVVRATLHNGTPFPLEAAEVEPAAPAGAEVAARNGPAGGALAPGERAAFRFRLEAGGDVRTTVPERVRLYQSNVVEPAVRLVCRVRLLGTALSWTEAVPCEIRPAVEFTFQERDVVMAAASGSTTMVLALRKNHAGPLRARMVRVLPPGWRLTGLPETVALEEGQREALLPVALHAPAGERHDVFRVRAAVQGGPEAEAAVHRMDVQVPPGVRVGLVRGADDTAEKLLRELAIPFRALADEDLARAALDGLTTVVADFRVLHHRPMAATAVPFLLRFAEEGGRLVVFYHKHTEFNREAVGHLLAPYPLELGRDRVTRADAPIRILLSDHPLFTTPHRIREEDFDGWVHERGLYFPAAFDPRYEELLSTADPGHPELRGGLLHAPTGRGSYVHCSLSLYRQLRLRRPGAIRLFVNLLTPHPPGNR